MYFQDCMKVGDHPVQEFQTLVLRVLSFWRGLLLYGARQQAVFFKSQRKPV